MLLRKENAISDETLMLRFGRGDESAFQELVGRYRDRLLNFIYRRLSSVELAEDLVQETFLRVVNAASRYQATAKFNTWLYTIALNLVRNEVARRRPPSCSLEMANGEAVPVGLSIENLIDFHRLQSLMQELTEDHFLVVELSFIEGWTNQQIADFMGCSVGTVKSRKFHALKELRKRMGVQSERLPESSRAN